MRIIRVWNPNYFHENDVMKMMHLKKQQKRINKKEEKGEERVCVRSKEIVW